MSELNVLKWYGQNTPHAFTLEEALLRVLASVLSSNLSLLLLPVTTLPDPWASAGDHSQSPHSRALLLSPSPDASLSHPISLNAVYTFVNGPFVYTAVNHLFEQCHLLPAGTLGDVAVIGVAFSLRSVSDFLCGPTESAILPEPQFLYLLNEPTGPPAFPISEGRCENSMS